ncbi:MAG: hypothetical protein ACC742_11175 [Thermoanaerobaculales bacterium]
MTDNETLEIRGLWLSNLGALFMAGLGIGFAILTSSDAVWFSLSGRNVQRPELPTAPDF